MTPDEAVRRARAGDEAGFLALWDALQPRLLRYLRSAGCDDADDVAGETWLQVVRDLPRLRSDRADEFRAWLFTIARHRAVDAARSRQRQRDKVLTADTLTLPVAPGSPVEEQVFDGLSTERAVALVAGLPREQAEAVALRVIAGLDTRAVGRLLGKSPGAVRVALHRGLRALARDPRVRQLQGADQ